MIDDVLGARRALLVKVRAGACAIPVAHVIEMMRPLPIEPVTGTPAFVLGVSIIRGVPTPIVDLGFLLGSNRGDAGRFVTLRLSGRQVALAVDAVLGVREIGGLNIQELPPLLRGASQDAIERIGTLDRDLLMVLRDGWQLSNEVLRTIATGEGSH